MLGKEADPKEGFRCLSLQPQNYDVDEDDREFKYRPDPTSPALIAFSFHLTFDPPLQPQKRLSLLLSLPM